MRIKIDYGIDLGTTNSAIARMERGVPRIIKSDTLKDTVPSCVHFNKKQAVLVGDPAVNAMKNDITRILKIFLKGETNTYIEFKRTMGTTHTYRSRYMNREFPSEELSAEVLKKLKSLVLDENLSSIVITVPAKFLSPQNEATIQAAKLAGFKQVVLLQEPVAAATAYGLDAEKKDGYWLVFDFGGGTFDAALVKAEEGILSVKDTDGDNWLGGKNLDEAIVDQIILPHLQKNFAIEGILNDPDRREILRNGVKRLAEEAKIQMSFKDAHNILTDLGDLPFEDEYGETPEVDVTVTQKDMERVLSPIFQKAIDIAKGLLKRNNLRGADLDALIPVGGPTHSPILRRMLREQITEHVDTSKDPMTVVAQGAALYASTVDVDIPAVAEDPKTGQQGGGDSGSTPHADKLRLDVKYEATSVEKNELVSIKALREKSTGHFPNEIFVDIKRADEAWSSGLKRISDRKASLVEVLLLENRSNSFDIQVFDEEGNRLSCEPDQFNIIQGIGGVTKMQVLSYHVGIAKYFEDEEADLFFPVKGLEKSKTLPATGVVNGLKTRKKIRPRNSQDRIRIPIYQGDYNAKGTDPALNDLICEVIITGDTIPNLLPENSNVDITIKIDESQSMHFKAYFPSLDYAEELDIEIKQTAMPSVTDLSKQIADAKAKAIKAGAAEVVEELDRLEGKLENEKGSADGKMNIQNSLRKQMLKLGAAGSSEDKWPEAEREMKDASLELNELIEKIGDSANNLDMGKLKAMVDDFNRKMRQIIPAKDVKEAKKLTQEMKGLHFQLVDTVTGGLMFVQFLNHYAQNFHSLHWSNPAMAKQLIEKGNQLVALGRTSEVRAIVLALHQMLPDDETPGGGTLK
ncbi:MAG: Hsp70 family protein [Tannerella sp.]|jgi:molecular chaperone DnaK|nr:Hsp70 family protein [Tannerella sp.]